MSHLLQSKLVHHIVLVGEIANDIPLGFGANPNQCRCRYNPRFFSLLGIFFNIDLAEKVDIEFYLPQDDYRTEFKYSARVRCVERAEDRGSFYIGVEFQGLTELERYRISIFVRNYILSEVTNEKIPELDDKTLTLTTGQKQ